MLHLHRLRQQGLAFLLVSAKSVKGLLRQNGYLHSSGFSTYETDSGRDGRFNATHTIFKGKAALALQPIGPKLDKTDFGVRVKKAGCILLIFWPAIGSHKYDWNKRQIIALTPVEVGTLISLGPGDSLDFCHDTSKIRRPISPPSTSTSSDPMKRNTNNISNDAMKRLSVSPLSGDSHDQGHWFNLSVTNTILKTVDRFTVPITKGEFAVIRTACNYILPHLMGWDLVAGMESSAFTDYSKSAYPAKHTRTLDSLGIAKPELEWER